jgi:hypothetical protein
MADLTPAQAQEERERVRAALASRGSNRCPCCGHAESMLLDGYIILSLSPRSNRAVLGGKTVSCAATACTKYGYVAVHSLTHLGLPVAAASH